MFQTGILKHNFNFRSVYHQLYNGTPNDYVSTHQDEWILVDYVFYSDEIEKTSNSTEMQLLGYLSLPTASECESINLRIPNVANGSDHLSLLAQFKLCFDRSNQPSSLRQNPQSHSNKLQSINVVQYSNIKKISQVRTCIMSKQTIRHVSRDIFLKKKIGKLKIYKIGEFPNFRREVIFFLVYMRVES